MQDWWNKDIPQDEKFAKSGKRKELDDAAYEVLLDHMRHSKRYFKDYHKLPHINEKVVLRNYVTELTEVVWKLGLKVSSKAPNNVIYWKMNGRMKFGQVEHIFDLEHVDIQQGPLALIHEWVPLENTWESFSELSPFLLSWEVNHFRRSSCTCYVPLWDVLGLCAYVNVPAWVLGSPDVTLLVSSVRKLIGMELY
ncbi:hypothetical protein O181_095575 [Austropuccinia psidii MF-1]|uniref:Uncharacterized protein n=1 Tax=Austropuccinia psidii MF-1 TaxID=1389203 RepID=A0A9Q3PC62_9BASI|nr:hypothetical protein [Austropuccinia psidii MF-1]